MVGCVLRAVLFKVHVVKLFFFSCITSAGSECPVATGYGVEVTKPLLVQRWLLGLQPAYYQGGLGEERVDSDPLERKQDRGAHTHNTPAGRSPLTPAGRSPSHLQDGPPHTCGLVPLILVG